MYGLIWAQVMRTKSLAQYEEDSIAATRLQV